MRAITPNLDGLPQPGDLFAGKYRIERVIGIGGMGVVLEAHHMHLDQRVAIKMLLPELANDAELVQRFVREGRAAVKIPGEHVARVLDVGTLPDGTPFMVMELLVGADLQAVLDERGPLPVSLAVDCVLQTCEALAHAHAMGIIHRDLKPPNLFLTGPDSAPVVKLLDFGISKLPPGAAGDLSMTKTRAILGSPLYMAPEQMRSARQVDARADIWGLGILLYTMLTGRPPFDSDSMPEVCAMIVQDPTPSIAERRASVPLEIARAVERCLEKDPERRFPSVAELARAIAPFASEQGRAMMARIEAVAPPGAPVSWKFVETTGASKKAPPVVVARTGSAWGDATPLLTRRSRARMWVYGVGLAIAVTAPVLYFGSHRRAASQPAEATAESSSASSEAPALAPVASSPLPSASSAASSVTIAPVAPSSAASSIASASPPPRRAPPRVTHPPPPAQSSSAAAPASTPITPPGWAGGRKD